MNNCTVEKIGGTSMSRFKTVLEHIIIGGRKGPELYNRIFVVSAYSGITNMLLEHKKNAEPGAFTYYINDDPKWQGQLIKIKEQMMEINKGFKDIGLDTKVANDFVEHRINETITCLDDLQRLCSYGHFAREEFIPAVRELLSSIGEAHSAFNSVNILNNNGVKAMFVDLTGWKDETKLPVEEVISKTFSNIDISKVMPIVTGYVKCTEGFVTNFERGYSEITLSKIASFVKAKEVVVHKEFDLCSADPEVLGADRVRIIPEINYDMADQLADIGMEAIHPKAAKELMRNNIAIRVKNIFQKDHPGTLIYNDAYKGREPGVEVICGNSNITAIEVWDTDMIGQSGYDYKLVSCLEKYGISYISKVASANTITHLVNSTEKNLKKCIDEIRATFATAKIDAKEVAIISLVGNLNTKGILGQGAQAIADQDIKIWTSITPLRQINLQFVVGREDYKKALSALHETFIEKKN
jgi:aspartate kinase